MNYEGLIAHLTRAPVFLKAEYTANVRDYGAKGDGVTDDTIAIRRAIASTKAVYFPKGDYVVTGELEIITPGQSIIFENSGGYAYGEDIGLNWSANTRLVARGTFARRVRTRRLYRATVSDPQDDPLSCVINIQAEGVRLYSPCVWLTCDYTNTSPSNKGDDVDVGIFVGCRVGVQMFTPQVIGYFRQVGIYIDVSGHVSLDRHLDLAGNPYPAGTVKNGADGTMLIAPYIRGPKRGLGILGAKAKAGQVTYSTPYYDQQLGSTVSDTRGSFGASDFLCLQGRIYGPDHHSNRRWADPTPSGGVLNQTSLTAEPDSMPCAVQIDGLAGNASNNIWGIRFVGTRIATFEAFRVRLGAASRVVFEHCHIEGRSGGRMNTAGTVIDTNDYTNHTYGDISALPVTDRTLIIGSVRQSPTDGLTNHYYGAAKPHIITDSGRTFVADYIEALNGELDLRAASGSSLRMRSGSTSICVIPTGGIYGTTTGTAANVNVDTSNILRRVSSAAKYKTNIQPITDDALDRFLQLDGVTYTSLCAGDDPDKVHAGFIANQADELGLHDLVLYDESGEVQGFAYERASAYLLELIKRRLR